MKKNKRGTDSIWKNKGKKKRMNDRRRNYDAINEVSKHVTKKGVIKGRNKKETRLLRQTCPHWIRTKKNEIDPALFSTSSGAQVCECCGEEVSTHFFSKAEVKNIIGAFTTLTNQMKFLAVSVNASNDDLNFIIDTHIRAPRLNKYYKKMKKIAQVQYRVSDKKKKKGAVKSSSDFGGWRTNFN